MERYFCGGEEVEYYWCTGIVGEGIFVGEWCISLKTKWRMPNPYSPLIHRHIYIDTSINIGVRKNKVSAAQSHIVWHLTTYICNSGTNWWCHVAQHILYDIASYMVLFGLEVI